MPRPTVVLCPVIIDFDLIYSFEISPASVSMLPFRYLYIAKVR